MKIILISILLCIVLPGCAYIGGDPAVKKWFRENLNDPKSLEVIDWGEKQAVGKHGADYARIVKYRAKNAFGGYAVKMTRFYIDESLSLIVAWEDQ